VSIILIFYFTLMVSDFISRHLPTILELTKPEALRRGRIKSIFFYKLTSPKHTLKTLRSFQTRYMSRRTGVGSLGPYSRLRSVRSGQGLRLFLWASARRSKEECGHSKIRCVNSRYHKIYFTTFRDGQTITLQQNFWINQQKNSAIFYI
jgi:hypothetical protein